MRNLWLSLKTQLAGPDGEEYFNSNIKNTAVPALKGTLISGIFNEGVSKLVLALTDSTTPEVTLILHNGTVKVSGEPNAQIEFQGVAVEFNKNLFMLTFDVSMDEIKGLKTEKPGAR